MKPPIPIPMPRYATHLLASLFLTVLMLVSTQAAVAAQAADAAQAGRVLLAIGRVEAVAPDGTTRRLRRRGPIHAGEVLRTGRNGRLQVRFTDGARVALRRNSELAVEDYAYQQAGRANTTRLTLRTGNMRTQTGRIASLDRSAYRLATPLSVISVRGTGVDLAHLTETTVGVFEGAIDLASSTDQSQRISLGEGFPSRYANVNANGRLQALASPPQIFAGQPELVEDEDADSEAGEEATEDAAAEEETGADEAADGPAPAEADSAVAEGQAPGAQPPSNGGGGGGDAIQVAQATADAVIEAVETATGVDIEDPTDIEELASDIADAIDEASASPQ